MYTVYILKTSKDTLYTGITNNLEKRLNEHKSKGKKSAKYMRSFESFELVFTQKCETKSEALKMEIKIKKLPRIQKNTLLKLWG